jgi:hypothetical protein
MQLSGRWTTSTGASPPHPHARRFFRDLAHRLVVWTRPPNSGPFSRRRPLATAGFTLQPIRSTHLRFRPGDAEPMAKAPSTDVMGGAIPSGHGTSGTVRAESVATRASVCSRRSARAALGAPRREFHRRRGSSSTTAKVTWEDSTHPRRYFEPLSATRRGPSTAMSHASRSTNSSTKCARILRVCHFWAVFGVRVAKPRAGHRSPKARTPVFAEVPKVELGDSNPRPPGRDPGVAIPRTLACLQGVSGGRDPI